MRLTHVRLLVDDFGAAFRFYRDVLGLETTFGEGEPPYAEFRTGDALLSIFERDPQAEVVDLRPPGDSTLAILVVDEVDPLVERFRDHVVAGPTDRGAWGGRVAYLRDPSGNLVELFQPIPMTE